MRKFLSLLAAILMVGSMMAGTVFFVNDKGWTAPKCYAWSPANAGWPGEAMTKEDYQLQGYDVYSYTATEGVTYGNCIFNNGNGAQTADLTWTDDHYFYSNKWYTRAELEGDTIEAPEVVLDTIYFVNTSDWASVNCYAWSPANASWPGEAMTEVAGMDVQGHNVWMYAHEALPNCIFNDGNSQTGNLTWTSGKYFMTDAWYTYDELMALEGDTTTTQPTDTTTTQPTDSTIVGPTPVTYYMKHAWEGTTDWSWKALEDSTIMYMGLPLHGYYVNNNWYGTGVNVNTEMNDATAKWYPASKIQFITTDPETEQYVAAEEPAAGTWATFLYSTFPKDTVLVWYETIPADTTTTQPTDTTIVTPIDTTTVVALDTIYYVNTSDWASVNCYAWSPANASWPGEAMTEVAGMEVEGHNVWMYAHEALANCIFNDGNSQTDDLSWTSGKYFMTDAWYTYDELMALEGDTTTTQPTDTTIVDPDMPTEGFGILVYGEEKNHGIVGVLNEGQTEFTEYAVTGVEFVAGDQFQIYDFTNKAGWVEPLDAASTAHVSLGEYWYVADTAGTYDIYIKMYGPGDNEVYVGFVTSTDTTTTQPTDTTIVDPDMPTEGFGILVYGEEKNHGIVGVLNEGQTEFTEYAVTGVEFVAGDQFQIYDFTNKAGWVEPLDAASTAHVSLGEYWYVADTAGTYDIYIKMYGPGDNEVYVGFVTPTDTTTTQPTDTTTTQPTDTTIVDPDMPTEGFGILVYGEEKHRGIAGVLNEGQTDFTEYAVTGVEFVAGDQFQIYDFTNKAGWVEPLDAASTAHVSLGEYWYAVDTAGTYDIYIKMYGPGNNEVYVGFVTPTDTTTTQPTDTTTTQPTDTTIVTPTGTTLYVIGTVNGWTVADAAYKMTEVVAGSQWTFDFGTMNLAGQQFKINDGSWTGEYNIGKADEGLKEGTIVVVNDGGSGNINLDAQYNSATNVVITLNKDAEGNFTLTATGNFTVGEAIIPDLYLRGGDDAAWSASEAHKFTREGSNMKWTLTLDVDPAVFGAFKIADANWGDYNFGATEEALQIGVAYVLANGGQSNITLPADAVAGNYTFTLTNEDGVWMLTVVCNGDLNPTDLELLMMSGKAVKTIENGHVVIIKNGVRYNMFGM